MPKTAVPVPSFTLSARSIVPSPPRTTSEVEPVLLRVRDLDAGGRGGLLDAPRRVGDRRPAGRAWP